MADKGTVDGFAILLANEIVIEGVYDADTVFVFCALRSGTV